MDLENELVIGPGRFFGSVVVPDNDAVALAVGSCSPSSAMSADALKSASVAGEDSAIGHILCTGTNPQIRASVI